MNDDALDLIREIAAEHGVALDRSDPVLILQTATRKILQDALVQSRQAMDEAMAQHRSELELAASKWQSDAKRAATQMVQDVQVATRSTAASEVSEAAKAAGTRLEQSFARHEKALARSTLTCVLAAAIVVLAGAALLWMSSRAPSPSSEAENQRLTTLSVVSPSAFLDIGA
jgi:hypothetical protein